MFHLPICAFGKKLNHRWTISEMTHSIVKIMTIIFSWWMDGWMDGYQRGNFSIWTSTGCIRRPKKVVYTWNISMSQRASFECATWHFSTQIYQNKDHKKTYKVTFLSFAFSFLSMFLGDACFEWTYCNNEIIESNKPVTLLLGWSHCNSQLTCITPLGFQNEHKTTDSHCFEVFTDTNSLIVLCSFPQGYPGLLWELSWICSTPTDALAFGVVNVPKIIKRSSLANLQQAQQIFTDGNQSDQCYNYILKIHWHQTCLLECGLANYSMLVRYAVIVHTLPMLWFQSMTCGLIVNKYESIHSNKMGLLIIKWTFYLQNSAKPLPVC